MRQLIRNIAVMAHADAATSKAGKILSAGLSVPKAALATAKLITTAAMAKIETRYGKNIKRAVSIAILAALPIPGPGASAAIVAMRRIASSRASE